jgi:hypothetical protein
MKESQYPYPNTGISQDRGFWYSVSLVRMAPLESVISLLPHPAKTPIIIIPRLPSHAAIPHDCQALVFPLCLDIT